MNEHLESLRRVSAELKQELDRCAIDPAVESVHRVRTGTRRVQAMAETVSREIGPANAELQKALRKWLKELKRLRRSAGPVRDLDVHRKLLEKLIKENGSRPQQVHSQEIPPLESVPGQKGMRQPNELENHADRFDTWLRHSREAQAIKLQKEIQKRAGKFASCQQEFEDVFAEAGANKVRRQPRSAAAIALEDFARLSEGNPHLDEANLHEFRKGAKKARYVAETGGEGHSAQEVCKVLKKLQDDIGDWHDWLMMAEEARIALREDGAELVALLDAKVNAHYSSSLKTAVRLRGRLMGEWHAQRQKRPSRTRTAATHTSAAAS